jgi:hypothetical protein
MKPLEEPSGISIPDIVHAFHVIVVEEEERNAT